MCCVLSFSGSEGGVIDYVEIFLRGLLEISVNGGDCLRRNRVGAEIGPLSLNLEVLKANLPNCRTIRLSERIRLNASRC